MKVLALPYQMRSLAYSYISGIFLSIGANVFTGVYAADAVPQKAPLLLTSALVAIGASIAWLMLAAEVERAEKLQSRIVDTGISKSEAEEAILFARGAVGGSWLACAILLSALSLAILVPPMW